MRKRTIVIVLISVVLLIVAFMVADYIALSTPATKSIQVRKVESE